MKKDKELERDIYKAVLEGAEYPNIDNLNSVEFGKAVGEEVAKRTKDLIEAKKRRDGLIIDLVALLEHYVENRPLNWDGTTKTQSIKTIKEAKNLLKDE